MACRATAPSGVELTRRTSAPPARWTSHRAHAQQLAFHGGQVAQLAFDGRLVAEAELEAVGGLGAPEPGLPSQSQPSPRLGGGPVLA